MTVSNITGLTLAVTLTPCQHDSPSKHTQSVRPYSSQQPQKLLQSKVKISQLA